MNPDAPNESDSLSRNAPFPPVWFCVIVFLIFAGCISWPSVSKWWVKRQKEIQYVERMTVEKGDIQFRDMAAYFENGKFWLWVLLKNEIPQYSMSEVDDTEFEGDWQLSILVDDKTVHSTQWTGGPKHRNLWGSIDAPKYSDVQEYVDNNARLSISFVQYGNEVFSVEQPIVEKQLEDLGDQVGGLATLIFFRDPAEEICREGEELQTAKKYGEAIEKFNNAIDASPYFAKAFLNRGRAYVATKNLESAKSDFIEAVRLTTGDSKAAVELALFANRIGESIEHELEAKLPTTTRRKFYNSAAYEYATCPIKSHRNASRALKWAKSICEETGYKDPDFLATLAAAHGENGDFTTAIHVATKANELVKQNPTLRRKIQGLLKSFREGKPFRRS